MMYGYHGWNAIIAMVLGLIIFLAITAGLIFLVVWAVRRGGRPGQLYGPMGPGGPAGPAGPNAREILQARFAKGEITREQYREMLSEIDH